MCKHRKHIIYSPLSKPAYTLYVSFKSDIIYDYFGYNLNLIAELQINNYITVWSDIYGTYFKKVLINVKNRYDY